MNAPVNTAVEVLIGGPRDRQVADIPTTLNEVTVHFENRLLSKKHDGHIHKNIISGKYRRSTKGTFVWDGFC